MAKVAKELNQELLSMWNGEKVIATMMFTREPDALNGFRNRLANKNIISWNVSAVLWEIMKCKWAEGNPFPARENLAKRLGVSLESVRKAVVELDKAGLMKKIRRTDGGKYKTAYEYNLDGFIRKFAVFSAEWMKENYSFDVSTLFTEEEMAALKEYKQHKNKTKAADKSAVKVKIQTQKEQPKHQEQPEQPKEQQPKRPKLPQPSFDEVAAHVFGHDEQMFGWKLNRYLRDQNVIDMEFLRELKRQYEDNSPIISDEKFRDIIEYALKADHPSKYLRKACEKELNAMFEEAEPIEADTIPADPVPAAPATPADPFAVYPYMNVSESELRIYKVSDNPRVNFFIAAAFKHYNVLERTEDKHRIYARMYFLSDARKLGYEKEAFQYLREYIADETEKLFFKGYTTFAAVQSKLMENNTLVRIGQETEVIVNTLNQMVATAKNGG